jgi:hypothetical protein
LTLQMFDGDGGGSVRYAWRVSDWIPPFRKKNLKDRDRSLLHS